MMDVNLHIRIKYDTSEYEDQDEALRQVATVLRSSVDRMVGEGGLSGETLAEVESWDYAIAGPDRDNPALRKIVPENF